MHISYLFYLVYATQRHLVTPPTSTLLDTVTVWHPPTLYSQHKIFLSSHLKTPFSRNQLHIPPMFHRNCWWAKTGTNVNTKLSRNTAERDCAMTSDIFPSVSPAFNSIVLHFYSRPRYFDPLLVFISSDHRSNLQIVDTKQRNAFLGYFHQLYPYLVVFFSLWELLYPARSGV